MPKMLCRNRSFSCCASDNHKPGIDVLDVYIKTIKVYDMVDVQSVSSQVSIFALIRLKHNMHSRTSTQTTFDVLFAGSCHLALIDHHTIFWEKMRSLRF